MSNRTDKSVSSLNDRLTRLDGSNNNNNSSSLLSLHNDGLNYWRGKPVISADEWLRLSRAKGYGGHPSCEHVLAGLCYFPDDYVKWPWVLGVIDPENMDKFHVMERYNTWQIDYMDLMVRRRNPNLENQLLRKELTRTPPYYADDFTAIGTYWFPRAYGRPGEDKSTKMIKVRKMLNI